MSTSNMHVGQAAVPSACMRDIAAGSHSLTSLTGQDLSTTQGGAEIWVRALHICGTTFLVRLLACAGQQRTLQ